MMHVKNVMMLSHMYGDSNDIIINICSYNLLHHNSKFSTWGKFSHILG